MMRRVYDWMMRAAGHEHAGWVLAAVAFAESSFFPIPPDVMLVPMSIANRQRAWLYAGIATIASVVGGVAGYAIGYFFYELVGRLILDQSNFDKLHRGFNDWGAWIIIAKGMTPIPYKLVTISAGLAHMALVPFILASIVARAMRFFLVAGLLYWFGAPVRDFIERRLMLVTSVFLVCLVGGFVAVRFLF